MRARKITGFHLDGAGHWVAELECGHMQHVRHDPPLVSRPWILTGAGRASRLGEVLQCSDCQDELSELDSLPRPLSVGQVLEIHFPTFTPRITIHPERQLTVEIVAGDNSGFTDTVDYEAVAIRNELIVLSWRE